ncbi:hypothetical protein [Micromonospora chalcea]
MLAMLLRDRRTKSANRSCVTPADRRDSARARPNTRRESATTSNLTASRR